MPDGSEWPRISVITPSYNQAPFLEATLRSVLLQRYPNLEYFVLDGGSTDGSIDIIQQYAPWLTGWVSERDGGQSAAINRGLRESTGLFAAWINSDDMLCRDALVNQATKVGFPPGTVFLGDCLYVDEHDGSTYWHRGRVRTFEDLVRVRTVWRAPQRGHIVQPEVLFPRDLALSVGGLDVHNHRTMDYELWGRFFLAGATFCYTEVPFAIFRVHAAQKTGQNWAQTQSLVATAARLVSEARLPDEERQALLADLAAYQRDCWRGSGPLARLGLPEGLVLSLRATQATWRRRVSSLVRRPAHPSRSLRIPHRT